MNWKPACSAAGFQRAAKSGAQALQNPVQQAAAPTGMDSQETTQARIACGLVREDATCRKSLPDKQMPLVGLEPTTL
jgi:hypothetical protein